MTACERLNGSDDTGGKMLVWGEKSCASSKVAFPGGGDGVRAGTGGHST